MVRLYPEIAGFVRMNLSSQENEDTSPLTNTRMERDFGYVHSDFSSAGYGCVNSKNLVLPDYPPLTRQKAGSIIEIIHRTNKLLSCQRVFPDTPSPLHMVDNIPP